ncbi:MAG: amidase [Candidatus Methanoperedens sp.]|nr:amidase [Candidatus Methanoperedens sp.]
MKSILEAATALNDGGSTSLSLTEECLEKSQNPVGEGSRVFIRVYDGAARAQAKASDSLRSFGIVPSLIAGIPVSIKDLFDVAGETTLAGSIILKGAPAADHDATVVQRLRAAGAVIIGRTNMTEFAFSGLGLNPHYGTPLNSYDRATGRMPGGSSSGGAVSVTDGMAIAAVGTDTGGSVRIPSALCGLTGFKSTAVRVPLRGVFPLSSTLDSIGVLAPTVNCCAVVDSILAGEGPAIPSPASADRLCLAVPQHFVLDHLDGAVASSFDTALTRLSRSGIRLIDLPFEQLQELSQISASGGFAAAESYCFHRKLIAQAEDKYDPRVLSRIKRGAGISAADFIELVDMRRDFIRRAASVTQGFDAVLMPTVPLVAPPLGQLESDDQVYFRTNALMLQNTMVANFLDRCALSIPCHKPGDAPVGLTLMGEHSQDRHLLAVGLTVERILGSQAALSSRRVTLPKAGFAATR